MRALVAYPLAVLVAFLPRKRWEDWDLPVANASFASALLTFFSGAAYGISGYFPFMQASLEGREFTPPPLMLAVFLSYVFVTPRGVFSLYVMLSGGIRGISGWIGEPMGDPVLTLIDGTWTRLVNKRHDTRERRERLTLERQDEPDRRYDGDWAGLSGVDFVIVSARRKPGWTKGTYVMTSDGWFVLGEPFDRPMPHGLRTVYPLTEHRTLDVLRKGVSYELPPLRRHRAKAGHHGLPEATMPPPDES